MECDFIKQGNKKVIFIKLCRMYALTTKIPVPLIPTDLGMGSCLWPLGVRGSLSSPLKEAACEAASKPNTVGLHSVNNSPHPESIPSAEDKSCVKPPVSLSFLFSGKPLWELQPYARSKRVRKVRC